MKLSHLALSLSFFAAVPGTAALRLAVSRRAAATAGFAALAPATRVLAVSGFCVDEPVAAKAPSRADGALAYGEIVAAKAALSAVENFVRSSDFGSAASLLGKRPLSTFEANALVLVQAPNLCSPDDKKQIDTVKTDGLAAINSVRDAVDGLNAAEARAASKKAREALGEIIAIGSASGL